MTMNITGSLTFLSERSEAPVYHPSIGGAEARLDVAGCYENREIEVLDGRKLTESFSVDEQGFELTHHESAVNDIYDDAERNTGYSRECEHLVVAATGAVRAHCFDHTLRAADADRRREIRSREPTAITHNDYTPRSGPQRVRDIMRGEAEALLDKPFAILNVWRPIKPVESHPLAVCDARTLAPDSLVRAERRAKDRIGELYMVRFDPAQRWIYFPNMSENEALLIKTYDSREDGRSRWCVHTALNDAMSKPDAAARESIESRVFAFFSD